MTDSNELDVRSRPKTNRTALTQMMKQASSPEEKFMAVTGYLVEQALERLGTVGDDERRDDIELEKATMRHDLIKWVLHRVFGGALVFLAAAGIVAAWKVGERELAKDIAKLLLGVAMGFGAGRASTGRESVKD